jgi:hypothetical protein
MSCPYGKLIMVYNCPAQQQVNTLTEGLYIRCNRETRSYLYMQPFHLIHESAIYNETKYRLLYGQEFYIGEFKKQSCQRTFLGLRSMETSVDTEMCCPKGKCGCQYFILLT